jgi:hypothetical protein
MVAADTPPHGGGGGQQFLLAEDMLDQLSALRSQLMRLSMAEGRLAVSAAVPSRSTTAPVTALVPYNNSNRYHTTVYTA